MVLETHYGRYTGKSGWSVAGAAMAPFLVEGAESRLGASHGDWGSCIMFTRQLLPRSCERKIRSSLAPYSNIE